jgi:putative oxidoreductase
MQLCIAASAARQFHAAALTVIEGDATSMECIVTSATTPANTLDRYAPVMLSIMRIVFALTFFAHGTQKILGFPASDMNPGAFSLPWIAGMLELFGGGLLILGLFTRPVAFVLSGLMACAYFLAHSPRGFFPALNGGDAAILFCFGFLYLVFAGAGSLSLDALLSRKTESTVASGAPLRA